LKTKRGQEYLDVTGKVTVERRKLPNDELYNLYSAPDFIRAIKRRRWGWTGRGSTHWGWEILI